MTKKKFKRLLKKAEEALEKGDVEVSDGYVRLVYALQSQADRY